ncbi:MAG: MmcQ/YjbR family DNA-binding protein [Acuticoccus sp.]
MSVARLRTICMALPEAAEKETFGGPTFRVRDKIFAMPRSDDGRLSVWLKAPRGAQEMLIEADAARFFRPPYVGPKGWVGVRLDRGPDWDEVAALVRRSYVLVAPKRLSRTLTEEG